MAIGMTIALAARPNRADIRREPPARSDHCRPHGLRATPSDPRLGSTTRKTNQTDWHARRLSRKLDGSLT